MDLFNPLGSNFVLKGETLTGSTKGRSLGKIKVAWPSHIHDSSTTKSAFQKKARSMLSTPNESNFNAIYSIRL